MCSALGTAAVVAAVVGEVRFAAVVAPVKSPAKCRRAAAKHALHRSVVSGAELWPMGAGVTRPMIREDLVQRQRHDFLGLGSGQCGERSTGGLLTDFGEVQINHGRLERGVPQVGGNLAHAGSCLQHVSGVAMAQRVDADFIVLAHQAALIFGDFYRHPNAGFGHWVAAIVEGLLHRNARAFPAATRSREKPVGVTVPTPKHTESGEQFRRNGNLARFAAFGVADAQHEAFAIDVFGANVQRLTHAQSALIDEREVSAVSSIAKGS